MALLPKNQERFGAASSIDYLKKYHGHATLGKFYFLPLVNNAANANLVPTVVKYLLSRNIQFFLPHLNVKFPEFLFLFLRSDLKILISRY